MTDTTRESVEALAEAITRDRKVGTPGPWSFTPWHIEEDNPTVRAPDNWIICQAPSDTDARRIARVPNMEAELLSLLSELDGRSRGEGVGIAISD